MADDRIYLQCNICGKKLFLGKQFGWSPFYWENYKRLNGDPNAESLEDKLNQFYEDHCHPCEDVCKWNGNFSIVYEIDSGDADFDDIWGTRPGKWKVATLPKGTMNYCSECGFGQYIADHRTYKYCPNCGARMDGDGSETD